MFRGKIFGFIILFACALPGIAHAQNYLSTNFGIKEGLPTSEVYDVLQDQKGYLWFATDAGASRFDGYSFRNYTIADGLPANSIIKIFEDHKGRIWFTTMGDERLGWYENDSIYSFPFRDTLARLLSGCIIRSFYVDRNDNIYIGPTARKMDVLKISDWKKDFRYEWIKVHDSYLNIIDSVGYVYGKVAPQRPSDLTVLENGKKLFSFDSRNIKLSSRVSAWQISRDIYCYASLHHIFIFSLDGNISNTFEVPSYINNVFVDSRKNLWVSTNGGVYAFDLNNTNASPLHFLDKVLVSKVIEDKEGTIWITTTQQGIFHLVPTNFRNFSREQGLSGNKVIMIFPVDEKKLLVNASEDALNLLSADGKKVDVIYGPGGEYTGWTYGAIWINKDTFIVSAGRQGMLHFNRDMKLVHRVDSGYNFKMFLNTRSGKIIAGGMADLQELTLTGYRAISECCHRFLALCEDSEARLWAGTPEGLLLYNKGKWINYGEKFPLLNLHIDDVKERVPGELWVATRGKGIVILYLKENRIKQLTRQDGLAGDFCKSLVIDSTRSEVWVGAIGGLSRVTVNEDHYAFSNYDESQGLSSNEINVLNWWGKRLCIGTSKGLSIIDPASLSANTVPPPVYITGIKVQGKNVPVTGRLDLPYNRNYVVINYVGLSYRNPGKVVYKYRMHGIDTAWVYTTATSVQYPSLPSGNFRFEVYALNNDLTQSRDAAYTELVIAEPYWRTWWFLGGSFVMLGVISGVFLFVRIKGVKKREGEKTAMNKKLAEAQLTALRAQMNPHFIFNALASIQNFVLTNNIEKANSYFAKFSTLMRMVLQNSRNSYITLEQELDTLGLYVELEALRFSQSFDYEIRVDDEVDTLMEIPSMVIQPYIENAIWHGLMHKKERGKLLVHIRSREKDDGIICIVEDNGVGRKKTAELRSFRPGHKSMGMEVTRERLELLNRKQSGYIEIEDLYDAGGQPAGTRVKLTIPERLYQEAGSQ